MLPFEELYRRHAAGIYRFCLSQTHNPSEAEDVAADVFVAALADYPRAQPDESQALAWLYRIARNDLIDRDRTQRRRSHLLVRYFGRVSDQDNSPSVESLVAVSDELRRVIAVIRRLSERDQQLVGLRLAADLSYAEIGAVLGLSEHAATVATHRAVGRLRRRLERST